MATEEAVIRLGLDSRPVTVELQKVKSNFAKLGDQLKGMGGGLSNVLSGLGGKLAIGGAVAAYTAAVKNAAAYAHELKNVSDATGISGETLQAWSMRVSKTGGDAESAQLSIEKMAEKIGQARAGSKDAVEAFDKLGVSLTDANGQSKSTDSILGDVMDRVKGLADPTLQLAAAADIFGEKMGHKVVNALRDGSAAFEAFKKSSSFKILDQSEIDRLDEMQKIVKGAGNTLRALAGKSAVALSAVVLGDAKTDQLVKKFGGPQPVAADTESKAQNAKEVAKALSEYEKARFQNTMGSLAAWQKVYFLQNDAKQLAAAINEAEDGSVQQIELKTKLMQVQKEIGEEQKRDREEVARKEKEHIEDLKKQTEEKEKQARADEHAIEALYQINKQAEAGQKTSRDLETALGDQTKFTLSELVDSANQKIAAANQFNRGRSRKVGADLTPAEQDALDVQAMEAQARRMALNGDQAGAQSLMQRTDRIREGMSGMLKDNEAHPFKGLLDSSKAQEEALKELLRRASEEGINIVPAMGE
jgi:hypothetical protein